MKRFLLIITIAALFAGQSELQALSWFGFKTAEQKAKEEQGKKATEYQKCFDSGYQAALEDLEFRAANKSTRYMIPNASKPCAREGYAKAFADKGKSNEVYLKDNTLHINPECVIQ